MRKISVNDAKPGMRLARDVHINDGRLLLLAGFVLKPRYLEKLKLFNIQFIFVDEDTVPEEKLGEEKVYSEAFNTMKKVLSLVREGKELDVPAVKDSVRQIIEKVINDESVFMQLSGIRDIDNYTFLHSVDVCIYSVISGKNAGFGGDDLTDLAMGAILHDIGKCKVPVELLTKPEKLTQDEFDTMKLHTVYGQQIIMDTPGLNKRIACIACQHHERWDGRGYPEKLRKYEIDRFARIVAIADTYDAMTADRVYRRKIMPHEAVEYITSTSCRQFDPQYVDLFIESISVYPPDSFVLLNTGEVGCVVDTEKCVPVKPRVKVIARRDGPPVFNPYYVDLTEKEDVHIVDVLS